MSAHSKTPDPETIEQLDHYLAEIDDAAAELRDVREGVARQRAELLGESYPNLRLVPGEIAREMTAG